MTRPVLQIASLLTLLALTTSCVQRKPERLARRESPVSAELKEMVENQATMAADSTVDQRRLELLEASQRRRVLELSARALITEAEDVYRAALILHRVKEQSGADICLLAHYYAMEADRKGYPQARFLAAAALDRYLVLSGLPQRFGTQSVRDKTGHLQLYPYEPSTSDSERAAWGVPSLDSLEMGALQVNGF